MKDRIAIIFLTLSFIITSTYFSWFLYKAFMFLFMCYFQLYYRDFIPMKIINFTFFFIFLNKTTFKDKTHVILVQGLCRNLKQIKNGKKRNWLQFSEKEKMICVVFTKKNWKKMLGLTVAFIQGSGNFKTSGLSDHDKNKMQVQGIIEGTYI